MIEVAKVGAISQAGFHHNPLDGHLFSDFFVLMRFKIGQKLAILFIRPCLRRYKLGHIQIKGQQFLLK